MTLLTRAREKPILFSAPMVRAILDGRKTQTRRVVKPQPPSYSEHFRQWYNKPGHWIDQDGSDYSVRCPYGAPGDRLWVKETHAFGHAWDKTRSSEIPVAPGDSGLRVWYRADGSETLIDGHGKLRPSIFMPRWASRITLEVTGVRVERLHAITEEDAKAEGATPYILGHGPITEREIAGDPGIRSPRMYRDGFEFLWRSINGSESWDANPWVWVVEFRRVEAQERAA